MSWSQQIQYRTILTASGDQFLVPEHIVRVDDDLFAGWQLRYGEWTEYADSSVSRAGAEQALLKAIAEMTARVEYRGK